MNKFLKITLISLLLITILLFSLPFLLRGRIIKAAKAEANKNLNARLDFSDDIGISLFRQWPKLTIEMKEVCLTGIDTFSRDTLAYLPTLSVSLNLMSVIKGNQMEVSHISLDQPRLKFMVLENGRANWDIVKPDSTSTDSSASAFKMALEQLDISKGDLEYEDLSMPFYTELRSFDHKLKGDFTLDHFLMETITKAESFSLSYDGINYIHKVKADVKATLDVDMNAMKFTFKDNDVLLNELQLGGEGFVDMNDNDMDFDLVFNSKKTDFKTIMSMIPAVYSKDFNKAKASGKLDFSGYMKGKMTDDKMPAYGLKMDIDNGYFQYPDLPKSLSNIFLNLAIDNKTGYPDNTVVNLSRFDANIAGESLHATLLMKTPVSDPYTDGTLKGNINLSEFRSFMPLDKATELSGLIRSDVRFKGHISSLQKTNLNGFNANGSIAAERLHFKDPEMLPQGTDLNALITFNPKTQIVEQLSGKVGMSDFDVKGRLDNLFGYLMKDEMLKGDFTLKSNYFNANEFLTDEAVKEEPAVSDSLPLKAFDVPGNLDLELNSNVATLIYDNLKLTDLVGKIILRDKQMYFEKVAVNLLQGQMNLDGVYDSHNPKFPFSTVDFNINSLDILETFKAFDLVKKLLPIAKYAHGHFNAGIKLTNNFNQDLSVAYPTVSGDLRLGIAEAALKDFPILNIIADRLKLDKLKNLNLKNLNFKMSFLNGKVILDSMILPLWTGAKARISGYSALDQSMQYVAKLSIPRKDFGEANTALNKLTEQARQKGVNVKLSDIVDVDVLIGGLFTKPDVKVSLHDAKNSLVNSLKDQLADEAEKRKQALIDEGRRRADIAKKKTLDSLNKLKQMGIDKVAAERKAIEDKVAEERRKAEEKTKAELDKAKAEADRIKLEAERRAEEEKRKALEKLKGGIIKR